jgi:Transcription factor WhiB
MTTTDAMTALSAALLTLTHRDVRPPCGDGSDRWVSDDRDQRASAATQCQSSCPLVTVCRDYADAIHPTHGVWGGTDRTRGTRQPRQAATS